MLRPPRNPKKDRLVNWQLIFHAYGFIGVMQTFSSFAMSYWYLQRSGIPFSALWFKFGEVPANMDQYYYNARLNEASSIYFINLVVMYVSILFCSLLLSSPSHLFFSFLFYYVGRHSSNHL
jgi:sodium/potassium-transporting ATPase subunit alpha